MRSSELPNSEPLRLQALRDLNILDTSAEERFDRLTRLARKVFDVEISQVSLVDEDRQWLKPAQDPDAPESPQEITFCDQAILGDGVFCVSDASKDERFANNPLVQDEPHIRFYAGVPLRAVDGEKMGTLCIMDSSPRRLDADERETLKDIAHMLEAEMAAVHIATQDELTGITNRRGFLNLARNSLNLCSRYQLSASLVFIDLNRFKMINDMFGHAEGDRALITFVEIMSRKCRDSDLFARLGGDEFVLLLIDATKEQTDRVMARYRKALQVENLSVSRGYDLSFAYGAVEYDRLEHESVADLLAEGDKIMYQRKFAAQSKDSTREHEASVRTAKIYDLVFEQDAANS